MRERGTGRIYKQKGCNLWTIQYYKDGKRIREATGTSNEKEAKQKLRQRLQQLSTGTFVGLQVERIRVEDLWEPFSREQRINGRKRPKVPQARWEKHLKPFFGHMRVINVGTDALNQYVDERIKEGAKNATVNREIAVLRRMFRLGYYAKPQKVTTLPKFPRLKENNVRLGFVESGQYEKLAAAAPELCLRAMLEIYYTYGWRKSELIKMPVKQINLKAKVIRLEVGTTKNGEGREIFMTETVHVLLSECAQGKNPDDFLFTREDGKPVLDFRTAWRNMCLAAGVGQMLCRLCKKTVTGTKCESCGCSDLKYRGLILHDLRRTAARNLRRAGVAESVIMKIGGWKTPSVFKRYDIVDQRDKREAMHMLEIARQTDFGHKDGHNQPQQATEDVPPTIPTVN
ncbi:MAG TPA: site-specific integrase [Candidatus Angelobacter sp.]|nr:site-specific integrase [Candidatus Angelobacter sp.]